MYFVFFKIFNFNSSQMKYFSCQFNFFPFCSFLWKFFCIDLFGFNKILLLLQSVSRGMLQKGLLANTFFLFEFSFFFFFIYKVRNKLGKYFIFFSYLFIIEHFCLVLLVLLPCLALYSLPFTILFLIFFLYVEFPFLCLVKI